jgi:hypothetical protein
MATSDVSIVSAASVLVGGAVITSFEDGSTESVVAGTLYEDTRDDLLSTKPWAFNTKISTMLSKHVSAPDDKWEIAYQLPSDIINLISVNKDDVLDYDVQETFLVTNFDGEVYAEYQFSVSEDKFPSYFTTYLQMVLASKFAIPIADDPAKTTALSKEADRLGKLARNADARQKTNQRISGRQSQRSPFTRVR